MHGVTAVRLITTTLPEPCVHEAAVAPPRGERANRQWLAGRCLKQPTDSQVVDGTVVEATSEIGCASLNRVEVLTDVDNHDITAGDPLYLRSIGGGEALSAAFSSPKVHNQLLINTVLFIPL